MVKSNKKIYTHKRNNYYTHDKNHYYRNGKYIKQWQKR